jgi:uncharacterized protein DUF1579
MRRAWIALLLVAFGIGGWFARDAASEDGAKPPPAMPSEEEMMKKAEEMAAVGEQHKWLAEAEGTWDVAAKEYSRKGPVESKAVATFKMLLGGRFQEQSYVGTHGGKPYEGRGITGYDNATKQFFNYWFNTMGTSASYSKGQSADGKLTMTGTWENTPLGSVPFRQTLTKKSPKEMFFTIHMTLQGQEMPVLELTYTKR